MLNHLVKVVGGNCTRNIAASQTFWGFPSLDDHGSISFRQCPTDYCCPYRNVSCKYENQRYLASGCSGNRTGVLCGQCKSGYTETLFSAKCRENNNCKDYWFWPVVLLYSFAFSFFLLRKSSIRGYVRRILPWARKRAAVSDLTSDGSGYVKVIFYFYQVAGLVFVSKDSEMHLAENYLLLPVMGWFDFKAIGLKGGLVCPFLGLTVVSKIFLQASQVFAVLFGVLLIFVVNGAKRKIQGKRPVFPPADQYLAATVDCLVLSYSTLALTSLKALNCTLYRLFQFCIADLNCSLVKKFPRSGSCMLVCVPCRSPFGGWFFARRFPLLMQRPTKLAMNNCLCYLHVQVPQETIYPGGLEPSLHDLVE